jgi:UrcA family protein
MNMNPGLKHKFGLCIAAAAACALLAGAAQADDRDVTIAITVSTAGLDLSQPAGAREAYRRIEHAAYIACTRGNRLDLEPPASYMGCYEKGIGAAVGSAHVPQLSIVYLETHSPRDAAIYGIGAPARLASK